MNFIQSFWTPATKDATGGFPLLKYHLASWALSCLTIKKYYPNLTLYTDAVGADLLIGDLKLPYSTVKLTFESYSQEFPSAIWTLRKLYTYALQTEGFLHLDGDVFIWKPLPKDFLAAPLIAQYEDSDFPFYKESYNEILSHFIKVPEGLKNHIPTRGANAGIIGGQNHEFFKKFYDFALNLLQGNKEVLPKLNARNLSTYLEQGLYWALARQSGLEIKYLIEGVITQENMPELQHFLGLPASCDFIHVMEGKKNYALCEQLMQRLRLDFPDYFDLVIRVSDSLTATRVSIHNSRNVTHYSNTAFDRTTKLLGHLKKAIGPGVGSQIAITNIETVLPSLRDGEREVVSDAFDFEKNKLNYLGALPNYPRQKRHDDEARANNRFRASERELLNAQVQLSEYCFLVETEWNWTEKNEYKNTVVPVLDNLNQPPSYFKVALFAFFDPFEIREHLLDALSIVLTDLAAEPVTLQTLNEVMSNQFNVEREILFPVLLQRIRFLAYHGVITVK